MTTKRFWQIASASFTIIFVLVLIGSTAQAQWTASITVENFDPRRPQTKTVTFGVDSIATDGIDAALDVLAQEPPGSPPPPTPQPFLNIGFAGPGLSYLSTDIRPSSPWALIVDSSDRFTISWDIASAPADISLAVVSSDGRTIDMKAATKADFTQGGKYRLDIKEPAGITLVEPAAAGKGMEVKVEGVNFGANEQVTIDFGTATAIATATADDNGAFSVTFIAVAQPSGIVTITATGVKSKEAVVDSTFEYLGLPTVPTSLNVVGSPAKAGETITVILEGEAEGEATFSIGEVIQDVPMVEEPPGVYTGEYIAEEGVTAVDATVIVTLTDTAGNFTLYTADQKVTIRSYVDYTLSLSKGINMISAPLDTTTVMVGDETIEQPIKKVSDLSAVLGDDVSLIISYDMEAKKFQSFTKGTPEDAKSNVDIGPTTGLIAVMANPTEITFRGNGWQPGALELSPGINFISVPLNDPNLAKVSDLAAVLGQKVTLIISYDAALEKFQSFTPGTPEDAKTNVAIEGGQSLILSMRDAASVDLAGTPWEGPAPPPPPAPMMFGATTVSPVLELDGIVVGEDTNVAINDLSMAVRHVSTGVSMTDTTSDGRFSVTFVYLDNRLLRVGDILEITAHNAKGDFSIDPIRYALTQTDIELGRIALGNLVASVIPSRSELLANFPNPFNPETWIPFQLQAASDTFITIYDVHGRMVRQLELGYIPAGVYQTKTKAAYWDGTNDIGERVASGVYFYQLKSGEFSALRKMVILK
jgi:hypothetical protein